MSVNDSGLEVLRKVAVEKPGSTPKTEYLFRTTGIADTDYRSLRIAVTIAGEEAKAIADPGTRLADRVLLTVLNDTAGSIFFGPSAAAATTDMEELSKNQRLEVTVGGNVGVFLKKASGAAVTVVVQEWS